MASTNATQTNLPQHERTYSTFSRGSGSSRDSGARPAANVKPVRRGSDETPLLSQPMSLRQALRPAKQSVSIDLEANRPTVETQRQPIDWEKWIFLAIIGALYLTCLGLLLKTQLKYADEHGGCWWDCDHPEKADGHAAWTTQA